MEIFKRLGKGSSSEKRKTFNPYRDSPTKKDEKSKDSTSNIPNDRKSQQRREADQWIRDADSQLASHWERVLEDKKSKDTTSNIPVLRKHYDSRIRWEADIDQNKSIIQSSKEDKAIKKIKEKESAHIVIPEGSSSSKGIEIKPENTNPAFEVKMQWDIPEERRKQAVQELNRKWEESLPEDQRNMDSNEREEFFDQRANDQEELIKRCLEAKKGTPEYEEYQKEFNKLAHEIMKETENVEIPLGDAKGKFEIEKLSNKAFIEELTRRKDDSNYQDFRKAVESDLANWYHTWGFADLKEGSLFEDESDATYDAVHNVITKAVESHIDKQLQQK